MKRIFKKDDKKAFTDIKEGITKTIGREKEPNNLKT